jgi:multiple antibiotic resistance protein
MICGPGAITNAIVLMEDANSLAKTIILVVSILVIMLSNRDYLLMYLLK